MIVLISYQLLYSVNPSLCTDTTGCGTCQSSIYNIVKLNYYTLHININSYNISGSINYQAKHYYKYAYILKLCRIICQLVCELIYRDSFHILLSRKRSISTKYSIILYILYIHINPPLP
jgi:hypothetical protein